MVPNCNLNVTSGWTNYSGTVISQWVAENKMGYRGSKSDNSVITVSVKEQRVDDGYFGYRIYPGLRYTLMAFEKRYRIKILSNQLNKLSFSTLNFNHVRGYCNTGFAANKLLETSIPSTTEISKNCNSVKLNPWFITGFSDAESSFAISIYQSDKSKTKWRVAPVFIINLHIKDIAILEAIKISLGVGKIRTNGVNKTQYIVESFRDLQVIIDLPFGLEKYPLISAKICDYTLFKECFEIIKHKQHLTESGLLKLVSLKASLNWGLSDNLKRAFPNIIPIERPQYIFKDISNLFWISGFISGEGSFQIITRSKDTSATSYARENDFRTFLRFAVNLHIREEEVIKALALNFKRPEDKNVYLSEKSVILQITKISDIINIVIPFFDKYPVFGIKSLDFADFKKVAFMIKSKEHLTQEGFNKILKIKSNMNQRREWKEENDN